MLLSTTECLPRCFLWITSAPGDALDFLPSILSPSGSLICISLTTCFLPNPRSPSDIPRLRWCTLRCLQSSSSAK
ncbi:hypothetical protein DAEQUDRAFT_728887 [Daedalea quercina L-15889]|uniref:Uncharacterized protein n=1 Tax=Daedalea quercina L-15889 TaxID=1314783 RepID=A0A165P1L2_9APHY|nr:hypothetical protein DAEQUDRAFT_728887 [Daedalea quercina L-15889]